MYEDQTPEVIKARILSRLTKLDTREGSFADDMVGPVAAELSRMYATLDAVRYMVWVDETSGMYLDLAAEDLGMEPRKAGTHAQTTLTLTGKPGYVVPAGTSYFTDDSLYFLQSEDAEITEDGSVSIVVTAREVGTAYNIPAHSIPYCSRCDVRLVSVDNPTPAMDGSAPESDAALYARIVAYRQRPATSGNEAHYEQWAMEVDGVGAAKVQGLWNGPGTVRVLIADEDRQPVEDTVLQSCIRHIAEMHPVGPEVTVISAEPYSINVTAAIRLKTGTDIDTVSEAFRVKLNDYFGRISLVYGTVLYTSVGALLLTTEGVVDYTDITLNGTRGNVTLRDDQVLVTGEVVITSG